MRNHEKITIALAGNPNCGKTTLFNLLTKSGEAVGNRAGVTFEPKKARMRRFADSDADIVDLPGCYSLSPYGNEEKVAERYIKSGNYDVIIDIADATNLDRSLYLTLQLIEAGARVVLALNMMDEAEKEEIRIDIPALAEALGIPVFPISAESASLSPAYAKRRRSLPVPSAAARTARKYSQSSSKSRKKQSDAEAKSTLSPTESTKSYAVRMWGFPSFLRLFS